MLPNKNTLFAFSLSAGHREQNRVVSIDLKKLTIGQLSSSPSNELFIKDSAFENTSINNINIPDSVEKIDNYTFSNCTKLNKITLGKGIKEIGKHAFCNTSIDKIIIPSDVEKIEQCTFKDCINLKEIILNDKIKEIGDSAFENTNIKNIEIPSSIEQIRKNIFGKNKKVNIIFK